SIVLLTSTNFFRFTSQARNPGHSIGRRGHALRSLDGFAVWSGRRKFFRGSSCGGVQAHGQSEDSLAVRRFEPGRFGSGFGRGRTVARRPTGRRTTRGHLL